MNTNNSQGNNNSSGGGNNNSFRKNKRVTASNPSNPKTKKQLENELNRQRSFFVTCSPQNLSATRHSNTQEVPAGGYLNRSNSSVVGQKKHPTLAIYRPPTNGPQKSKTVQDASVISEDCSKLNVHAKEFSLERSNTAPQSISNGAKQEGTRNNSSVLSRSRTFYTNDIKPNSQKKSYDYKNNFVYKNNFQQMKYCVQQKDTQGPKVQFKESKQKSKSIVNDQLNKCVTDPKNDFSLRRSKTYNGPDSKYYQNTSEETRTSGKCQSNEFYIKDLNCFPEDINDMAKRIVKDTKNSPTKDLMLLALKIIEHVVNNQDTMKPSVNLSLYIIERDTRDTYVNMIINTIQLWFVKREKLLQPPRFFSYATFVLQMYKGMKQNKVLSNRMEKEAYSRKQTLLMLLFKICEHCLMPSKENTIEEIECLFNIVDSIGRDLEQEVPDTLKQLYVSIRDVMLTRDCSSSVKKTLLHLIELRASQWSLPSSAVHYYNSKTDI
ncbi:probable cyclin-dependent serine/threonine-protein kinase DDB_G0292550 isoform X2 [Melanaphis sacchari]|uniref:probable cyclin-dependent serine/threonine-protein kinase DDB_G0292550 isoform X2 n=1 Tax=Melanaphis sacchari TaxID=742174 RepID=UPI000DC12DFF|nr:probable cyclin-dependent serine/threonine-protein kinase DDB_G0292550 isoform X2 [Melanaphis sacchari]